jgi:DNA-binding CsgD family transcriptional regulator
MQIQHDDIYEALFDDDAFANLPALLAQAAGGRSALVLWNGREGEYDALAYSYFSADWMKQYAETWSSLDPWVHAAQRPERSNHFMFLQQYVPEPTWTNSTIYNDFIRPTGDDSFHACGVGVSSPWGTGIVGIHRGRAAGEFEEADVVRLKTLLPDLGRVLRVRTELASARRDLSISVAAQDRIRMAILVARADGYVLQNNATAEAILRRGDGLRLKHGRVTGRWHEGASQLAECLAQSARSSMPIGSTAVIERGPGEAPYLVTVTPLVGGGGRSRALLLFRDPATEDGSLIARLQSLFGLTNVEAVVAVDLAAGVSPAEIAQKRGVRTSTIKTQVKSIMAKTGSHRQSEIAAVVAGLPQLRATSSD